MEVIGDATEEGQRRVPVVMCTATSVKKRSSGSQLPARIHVELEVTVDTNPIRGRSLASSVLLSRVELPNDSRRQHWVDKLVELALSDEVFRLT